jgi:hypothetical protein
LSAAVASDAMADAVDPAELFDVEAHLWVSIRSVCFHLTGS